MYNIAFFENGAFVTLIGGPAGSLSEALAQVKRLVTTQGAQELKGYVGYKYDRHGTPCAALITDRWGNLLRSTEEEKGV